MSTCVVDDCDMIIRVLSDYEMTTYFFLNCKSTHNVFRHDLTPCHVELLKQAIWHDFSDHNRLIQYDYKFCCEHNYLKIILLVIMLFNDGMILAITVSMVQMAQ